MESVVFEEKTMDGRGERGAVDGALFDLDVCVIVFLFDCHSVGGLVKVANFYTQSDRFLRCAVL